MLVFVLSIVALSLFGVTVTLAKPNTSNFQLAPAADSLRQTTVIAASLQPQLALNTVPVFRGIFPEKDSVELTGNEALNIYAGISYLKRVQKELKAIDSVLHFSKKQSDELYEIDNPDFLKWLQTVVDTASEVTKFASSVPVVGEAIGAPLGALAGIVWSTFLDISSSQALDNERMILRWFWFDFIQRHGAPPISTFVFCSHFQKGEVDFKQRFRFDSVTFTAAILKILKEFDKLQITKQVKVWNQKKASSLISSRQIKLVTDLVPLGNFAYRNTFTNRREKFSIGGHKVEMQPFYVQYLFFAPYLLGSKKGDHTQTLLKSFQSVLSEKKGKEQDLFVFDRSHLASLKSRVKGTNHLLEIGFVPGRWLEGNAVINERKAKSVSVQRYVLNLSSIYTGEKQ